MLENLKFVVAVFTVLDIHGTKHSTVQSWACLEHMCLRSKRLLKTSFLHKPCPALQTLGQHRLPPSTWASESLRHQIWTGWLREEFCYWLKNRTDWSCVTGKSKYLDFAALMPATITSLKLISKKFNFSFGGIFWISSPGQKVVKSKTSRAKRAWPLGTR